jgi:hypothetical protein
MKRSRVEKATTGLCVKLHDKGRGSVPLARLDQDDEVRKRKEGRRPAQMERNVREGEGGREGKDRWGEQT